MFLYKKKTYRLLSCYSDSSYYMAPSQFRFIIRSLIHHATAIWPPITLARALTCPRSSDQRSPNRIAVYHDTTLHLSSKSVIIIRRHRLTQSVKTRTNEDRSRTACPGNSSGTRNMAVVRLSLFLSSSIGGSSEVATEAPGGRSANRILFMELYLLSSAIKPRGNLL